MSKVCLLLNSQFTRGNGQSSAYVPTSLVLLNTPIARAVLDSRAVREGPYVNGKPRATGRATKFQTK